MLHISNPPEKREQKTAKMLNEQHSLQPLTTRKFMKILRKKQVQNTISTNQKTANNKNMPTTPTPSPATTIATPSSNVKRNNKRYDNDNNIHSNFPNKKCFPSKSCRGRETDKTSKVNWIQYVWLWVFRSVCFVSVWMDVGLYECALLLLLLLLQL